MNPEVILASPVQLSGPSSAAGCAYGILRQFAVSQVLLGFSWLSFTGFQSEFAAVKQNSISVVFKDTEATRRGFDRLNPTVESFNHSVTDWRGKPRQDSVHGALQHPRDLPDGIEPAANRPRVP